MNFFSMKSDMNCSCTVSFLLWTNVTSIFTWLHSVLFVFLCRMDPTETTVLFWANNSVGGCSTKYFLNYRIIRRRKLHFQTSNEGPPGKEANTLPLSVMTVRVCEGSGGGGVRGGGCFTQIYWPSLQKSLGSWSQNLDWTVTLIRTWKKKKWKQDQRRSPGQ